MSVCVIFRVSTVFRSCVIVVLKLLGYPGGVMKKGGRSASADSSTSSESSTGSHSALKNTGAVFTTEERKQQFLARSRKEQERDRECSRKTLADTSDSTDIAASVPGPTHMPRLRASSQKDSVPTTPTLTQKWFQNRLIGGNFSYPSLLLFQTVSALCVVLFVFRDFA